MWQLGNKLYYNPLIRNKPDNKAPLIQLNSNEIKALCAVAH